MDDRLHEIQSSLRKLATEWSSAQASERANAATYLDRLCRALEVEPPRPSGTGYEFEYPVRIVAKDGTETNGRIDLYKEDHLVLEAKDYAEGRSSDVLLRKAFGQAHTYARSLPGSPPPYLMVMDVAKTLIAWDRWSGAYLGYNAGRKIDLRTLAERPDDIAFLRAVWEDPESLNPGPKAAAVTREIAERLAKLARSLEQRGHEQERVARFLIRCVFTMFAEDMGLLQDKFFQRAIEEVGFDDPDAFMESLGELWRAMDKGKHFGLRRLLKFNGHFFAKAETLPLTRDDLGILLQATKADWRFVEPSIFGTLLTRALDPEERHRLGAEYTPREFVERLVRPTVEEPVRERWTLVQAEVLQLRETRKKKDEKAALERLREFHRWLRGLRILDPACGSGNFLYVTLAILKRVEMEVFRAIEEITGHPEIKGLDEIGPEQFHGIEVKPWARELAELTLWIGYHQAWVENHGHVLPPEPVLRDTGTLEQRDAVLAWDRIEEDRERSRPDPTPRIRHPVTGDLVPDPEARLPYLVHVGARSAEWPRADFVIGNPPYMGRGRQREAFGDGYVDALRRAYPDVPDNADYVMYWWHKAAENIANGTALRAGLITTKTITQQHNREVVEKARDRGANVTWAIPDHPWVDEAGSADVRVAMTVISKDAVSVLARVNDAGGITETQVPRLNADLTADADVATASSRPLLANQGLSSQGFNLVGKGFVLPPAEGQRLLSQLPDAEELVRPFFTGQDLNGRPRGLYVIDFGVRTEPEAREHPVLYDLVRDRVKPERDANNDRSARENWWRFGRNREQLREAMAGLSRYIVTVEASKHRIFSFLDRRAATTHMVVWIASDDAFVLGVLSSSVHAAWSLAAGGKLVDRPMYTKSRSFDPFPFPDPSPRTREAIAEIAEKLNLRREEAVRRDDRVTMTGIYNVIEKLRAGDPLTKKEREIHESAACGVLRDLHDDLDRLVAEAYGWLWPLPEEEVLARLVALHDERVREEEAGLVRWLRPDYQTEKYGAGLPEIPDELELADAPEVEKVTAVIPWPKTALDQIAALKQLSAGHAWSVEEAASRFKGARRDLVERHLETLAILGELNVAEDGRYRAVA